tara:strand:- start:406 stop:717 length:312 start_codon:yes stop_codon:yes gene_type:complete
MKSLHLELSKYESVNFLWSEFIEHYGFERAKNIISQAIDLQKMNGKKNMTIPIIFSSTGGLALIPIKSFKKEALKNNINGNQVLIFNFKKRSFQVLNEALNSY